MTAYMNGGKVNYEFSKGVLILKHAGEVIEMPVSEVWRILKAAQQIVQADFAAECAYDEPCKQCIHPVCKNYAKAAVAGN